MTTVTVDLPPEKEDAFKALAQARGLSLERWLIQVAEQHVPPPASESDLQDTDPKEWSRRFHAWTQSQRRDTPRLSDEAISRESIHPDRS